MKGRKWSRKEEGSIDARKGTNKYKIKMAK